MAVELRFFASIRDVVGARIVSWELDGATTIRDVLSALEHEYPDLDGVLVGENGEIAGSVTVLHNGRHVAHRAGADTHVSDGDRVAITLPVTGG